MTRSLRSTAGRIILFGFIILSAAAAFFLVPQKRSEAAKDKLSRTGIQKKEYPNYDIRSDKTAVGKIEAIRRTVNKNASAIADARESMVSGEEILKDRVPTLKIEYSREMQIPEVIATDVKRGKAFLTRPSGEKRSRVLKEFLVDNSSLIGARRQQIENLKVFSDYTNPDGKLSFVELNQEINGVPIFQGEIKAGFTRSGEIVRVINNFAPGMDEELLSTDFGDPAAAVRYAAEHIENDLAQTPLSKNETASTDLKSVFGENGSAATAEKMYFPTEPGVAVAAWRVLISGPNNAFYVIVDAKNGTMLWRKNLTEDQSESATYNVYANPNAMINAVSNPFPLKPGPLSPDGSQGTSIPRTLITRTGNEFPYTFNNLGWITDGGNTTDGNNVQAGLDREIPNSGVYAPNDIDPAGMAAGSPNRVFDFPVSPGIPSNPELNTGESPLPAGQTAAGCLAEGTAAELTDFQKASVTQLFYIANIYHDELYRLGFTEAARNFQNDNFGRGGLGGDRLSAQAQDCSDVNNANFTTPADGTRPQMQMFLWTGPNPDFDSSFDADVVIHELTHGTSSRLHGNSSGLFLDIARGMGEGWSDFFAHCLLSEPSDPLDGLYTIASYDTYRSGSVGFNNYYYGIRRFPTAIMASVGGPKNRPHNPMTFGDIDTTQIDLSDGAFAPRFTGTADQVHNIGSVWSAALWEIRARMIQRLGWADGNRRILQIVIDGMKLAPIGPTPLTERDAMIAGTLASGSEADVADIWAGFALRGFGASASIQSVGAVSTGGGGLVRVTEAFDLPNITQSPSIAVIDSTGDNDGFPEPGETVMLSIPLTNSTGRTATGVSVEVLGGGSAVYGTLSGVMTATQSAAFTIPLNAACGGNIDITLDVDSSLGPVSFTRTIFVGSPGAVTLTENFDTVAAAALPAGWSATAISGGINFVNSTTNPDSGPNAMFALDPLTVGGGTDLTSPPVSVTSETAAVTFRNNYATEPRWDGGVLEISIAGDPFRDILTAGGSFIQNGYNGVLGGGANNPLANRPAWVGNSNGYITTTAQLPAGANGKIVKLRWRFGADDNTAVTGWFIDSIALNGAGFVDSFVCSVDVSASVSISGRVTTPGGLSLRNASVSLTDSQGVIRRVTTSSFGIYNFDGVQTGQSYTIGVSSKRYRFAARAVNVSDNLADVDFVGLE